MIARSPGSVRGEGLITAWSPSGSLLGADDCMVLKTIQSSISLTYSLMYMYSIVYNSSPTAGSSPQIPYSLILLAKRL
jgi:hypothetical protein